jgi:biotin carboxyl carrier protein
VASSVGANVEAGAVVVVLEAMKMEHAVVSTIAGRVAEMRVAVGDQVGRGQVLAVVEP